MRLALTTLAVIGAASSAAAQDSVDVASQLGSVIGSEAACGLSYHQEAITAFIDERVAADDMSFASTLQLMVDGTRYQIDVMSQSAKTAHCRQTERVARSYGFIE